MTDKLMFIPNDDTQKFPLSKLKLMALTFEHSTLWTKQSKFTEVPKVKPKNKKTILKTLGTNQQPIVPSLSGQ